MKSIFRDTVNQTIAQKTNQNTNSKTYRYLVVVGGQDHVRVHHMKHLTTINADTEEDLIKLLSDDDRVIKGLCMNHQFRTRRWCSLDIRDVENTMGELSLTYATPYEIAKYVRERLSLDAIIEEIIGCTGLHQTIILYDDKFECLEFVRNSQNGIALQIIEKKADLYCYH